MVRAGRDASWGETQSGKGFILARRTSIEDMTSEHRLKWPGKHGFSEKSISTEGIECALCWEKWERGRGRVGEDEQKSEVSCG